MKPKHTPGPWVAEKKVDPAKFWVRAASGQVMAYVPDNPRSQYKANAALIAAAPEMLEALKRLVSATSDEDRDCDAVAYAEAAIAKAEGQSE